MIKPEMVPYNATREALTAWMGSEGTIMSAMERAIAAALNAWPGMGRFEDETGWDVHIELPLLVPLPPPPTGETNE